MSTDGIAYNHYGIKYVLKRLGDERKGEGSTHMEGELGEGAGSTRIKRKRNEGCLCEVNEEQAQ